MKTTNYPLDDDRGFVTLLVQLFHAALTPSAREAWTTPATAKPGWIERFDRWAAQARQRDRERFLSNATDVFDLELRLRKLENQPYF